MDSVSSVEENTNSSLKTVEEFKKSFVACMATVKGADDIRPTEMEEIKTDAEIAAQKFAETAQLTETDFNKKYLLFANYAPAELLKLEIAEMKSEIERKDALLNKYKDKLNFWLDTLRPAKAQTLSAPSLPGFAPIQQQRPPPSQSQSGE